MTDFEEEFGFLPPELIYKCHQLVKGFHARKGSGPAFVAACMMFSAESPYLREVAKKAVILGKVLKFIGAVALIVLVLAVVTSWWVLAATVPVVLAAIAVSRRIREFLVQERAVILAVELLAIDFAGWGKLFPAAHQRATAMFARDAGDWPKLVDLYFSPHQRSDAHVVNLFAPSAGSIASVQSAA
jgi:hypothetical protein